MEEAVSRPASGTDANLASSRDFQCLAMLLVAVAALRLWVLLNTEVPARDTIGFIRYALEFEKLPVAEVLNKNHQHPGYPLVMLAVSQPIRYLFGTNAVTMQISAQVTSALASTLLVIPMFLLGRALFSRRVGFWAALLFQVLPISGHHLSDGISEPLFVLLTATALWLGLRAICEPSPFRFTICGLMSGLAYLTRPEGALLLAAAAGALVIKQLSRERLLWKRFAFNGAALCAAALASGSLYFGFTGKFTNKPSVHMMLRGQPDAISEMDDAVGRIFNPSGTATASRPLFASTFALTFERRHTIVGRLQSSLFALGTELFQSFHYFASIPFVLGAFWHWRKLARQEAWMIACYCGLHLAVLLGLAMSLAYVSDRHTMTLVMCGCFLVAVGMLDLAEKLGKRIAILAERLQMPLHTVATCRTLGTSLLVVLFISLGVPKVLQPLHYNRAGHHAAGLWLADKIHAGDVVIDDHCWAHYYAGEVFREQLFRREPASSTAPNGDPQCYVVLTRSKDPDVQKERDINEAKLRALDGAVVFHWPAQRSLDAARVIVYAVSGAKRDLIRGQ